MTLYANISAIAALIGDATRTSMIAALSDGRSLTAGELATMTKVSPQTASAHLAKMVDGGLLVVQAQGRHRYYRLASERVVDIMEAIAALAVPAPVRSLRESDQARMLRFARTCYEHIAGDVGVALATALIRNDYIVEHENTYQLTTAGKRWLTDFGVSIARLDKLGESMPRHIDWTARRHHLGGPIAVAITRKMLELGWIQPGVVRRSIVVTELGKQQLGEVLGMGLD